MRAIGSIASLVMAFALAFPGSVAAQVVTPEIDRGLNWLQVQVRSDRTVIGEEQALAERLQVRCEVKATLQAFNRIAGTIPCVSLTTTLTEILARSGAQIPAPYWLADGGVAPDVGYAGSSVVDTAWALTASSVTTDQVLGAIGYLYGYQASSGGFGASWSGPESVAATGLIGRQLALQSKSLTGNQTSQLAAAAAWLESQAQSPGKWASLYDTALAHLFLVVQNPDPARDAATYEYFVANQKANGSWLDDPFLTALVLRAAGARSLPRVSESGYRLRVIDAVTRAPVQGAFVNGTSTDANGSVTILAVPSVNLAISITKTGYQSKTLSATITASVVTDLGEIELQPAANAILVSGEIFNDSTSQPVSGARVEVWINGTFRAVANSNANGHFESSLTLAGSYRLVISSSGFINSFAEFDATLGNAYQVDVRLRPTAGNSDGTFKGTVTDAATGAPIAAATVAWRSISNATRNTTTAADGTYTMTGLAKEFGDLTFSKPLFAGRLVSGVIPANPETVVAAQLVAGTRTTGQLTGLTKDSLSAAPLVGVRIDVVNLSTNANVATLTSDATGQFSLATLPFAVYRYTATFAGYLSLTGQFTVSSTTPFAHIHIPLLRAVGSISGTVVDKASGAAIAGATIVAGVAQVQSNAAGFFQLDGLAAGVYSVGVTAAGYRSSALSVSVVSGVVNDMGKVELVATPGTNLAEVFGTVKARANGAAIEGATVSVVGADPAIATATDDAGSFGLRDIALGSRQVRVVAPGYQPATFTMALTEPIRYRLDATLTAVDANEITVSAATDFASYGAYAPGKVTATFTVATGVNQSGQVEIALFDAAGRMVRALPEPGTTVNGQVLIINAMQPFVMPFTTGNLAPGTYRAQVSLFDGPGGAGTNVRALLASGSANFTIVATKKIASVTVIPLPDFTNVGVPTPTGYRVEIANKSNVAVDLDLDLRLQAPAGGSLGIVMQRVVVRPDELFKSLDLSAGTITFATSGTYPAIAVVGGVDPSPITARAIAVLPATRIEVQKKLLPAVVPPGSDPKVRIDIRLKGVGP